ncbi:MAG: NACHT domain-containing protein [Cyanobacteria bacterium P01_C01_bin.70]
MVVANAEQYLMVLGGPGIGKSTFLRKIGLEALKPQSDETKQIQRDCIPVLIELKEFRDDTVDLKQKIADEFDTCGFPEAEAFTEASLAQGKLLVLLDGLDEVPTRNLNTVIKHIEDFVDAHDQNAFVASCRIAAYRSSQGTFFNRFTDVTLAEFDDEQIEQFIRRWFCSQLDREAGTADRYWDLLQKDEHKATKELAQTPLLLTFLCLVYDREQTLPAQRSTLYGKALNILLSEWAAQKRLEQDPIYEGFHPDLEKVLLAEIAYESFKNDQLFFLKDDLTRRITEFLADTLDAPRHLDGAKVLEAIEKQQGILVERATDIYSFSHLTLQEYLTAFHIIEERLESELVEQHLTNERWREVFLLATGLSGNRGVQILKTLETSVHEIIASYPKLCKIIDWTTFIIKSSCQKYSAIAQKAAALAIALESINYPNYIDDSGILIGDNIFNDLQSIMNLTCREKNFHYTVITLTTVASFIRSFNNIEKFDKFTFQIEPSSDSASNMSLTTRAMSGQGIYDLAAISDIFKGEKIAGLNEQLIYFSDRGWNEYTSTEKNQKWAKDLKEVWFNKFEFKEANIFPKTESFWALANEEVWALMEYLYAIELLIRCKDSAVRIPKHAWAELEAQLLTV